MTSESGKDRFDGQPVGLDENLNQWSWGRVVTPDGEFIPPGACDGMHNKDQQREVFDR